MHNKKQKRLKLLSIIIPAKKEQYPPNMYFSTLLFFIRPFINVSLLLSFACACYKSRLIRLC